MKQNGDKRGFYNMQINREKMKERIKLCRKNAGLTQEELAEKLHVKRQIISYYESDSERTPNIDILATMAQLFNTTTDYLLGLTDVQSSDTKIKAICEYTGLSEEAIKQLHNMSGVFLSCEIDYLSDFIKQDDIFELLMSIGNYDTVLLACEKKAEANIEAYKANTKTNFDAELFKDYMYDQRYNVDYLRFLIVEHFKKMLDNLLYDSINSYTDATRNETNLKREYFNNFGVGFYANNNETK